MSLALSICVLFILLMQSVNGAQFLNAISIPLLHPLAPYDAPNLLYVLRASSLISTQFSVLNLVGGFGLLSKRHYFLIFHYYIIILI